MRQVAQADARLKESAKLGFDHAVMPRPRKATASTGNISVSQPSSLADLIEILGGIA
jgi:predicted ATP-dependent serine protease